MSSVTGLNTWIDGRLLLDYLCIWFFLLLINHFINLDTLLNFRKSYLSFLWSFLMKKLSWLERQPWSIYNFLYLLEIINNIGNHAPQSADPQIRGWTRKFVLFFKTVIPGLNFLVSDLWVSTNQNFLLPEKKLPFISIHFSVW